MLLNGLTAFATAMSLFGNAPASSNFFLRVGPGVNATVRTASMHLSCSDDARCRFEVPRNSTFELVATAGAGHQFRWTGCNAQLEANRCRVEVRGGTVSITVR